MMDWQAHGHGSKYLSEQPENDKTDVLLRGILLEKQG